MLKSIADHQPSTPNPSTSLSANRIMMALITNKNKPSDSIVTGSVSMINIGFTKTFRIEMTIATSKEVI